MKTKFSASSDSKYTLESCQYVAELGGNVVDIAVAGALAASFSELLMCSLGGSAFINIKLPNKKPALIDGSDAMPMINNAERIRAINNLKSVNVAYGDGININIGHASVAIPGMLKALELASQKYGRLAWKDVIAPAIELAKEGCLCSSTMVSWLDISANTIFNWHSKTREIFFPNDRDYHLNTSDMLSIPFYVDTLEAIAREGSDVFYRGEIAKLIEDEVVSNGGFLDRKSLARYEAIEREPLVFNSHGYTLATNPPPAVGGAMFASMIKMYDQLYDSNDTEAQKNLKKVIVQKAMLDLRSSYTKDYRWNAELADSILEKDYLAKYLNKSKSPHTMHMSVATEDGGVVAITMSNGYGSGVTIPKTGITLNNSLGEPELNPAGFFKLDNLGRLVSNMTPTTIWSNKGNQSFAIGTPGASRITTSLFQAWINYSYENMFFDEMVNQGRLHCEYINDELIVQYEEGVDISLIQDNFKVSKFPAQSMYFGAVNIAGIGKDNQLHAFSDNRRDGAHISSI